MTFVCLLTIFDRNYIRPLMSFLVSSSSLLVSSSSEELFSDRRKFTDILTPAVYRDLASPSLEHQQYDIRSDHFESGATRKPSINSHRTADYLRSITFSHLSHETPNPFLPKPYFTMNTVSHSSYNYELHH